MRVCVWARKEQKLEAAECSTPGGWRGLKGGGGSVPRAEEGGTGEA